jgi:hypothetical protein
MRRSKQTRHQQNIIGANQSGNRMNFVVSKASSIIKVGYFHFEVVREGAITFSKESRRISKEVVRKDLTVRTKTYQIYP